MSADGALDDPVALITPVESSMRQIPAVVFSYAQSLDAHGVITPLSLRVIYSKR